MATELRSRLLIGHVLHTRLRPIVHRFRYPVFCLRLDLAELAQLQGAVFGINRWRPLSLYFKDYGPRDGSDLQTWARQLLAQHGIAADGRISLQTFPRIFGFAFNPISLWYCERADGALMAVLAEVNNTFGEHHFYLLHSNDGTPLDAHSQLQAKKMMHVSPFCQVKGSYRFRFRERPEHSLCQINYFDGADSPTSTALIHTAISGQLQVFSQASVLRALLKQPLLTLGVVVRIHWQALLLWRKRVPFFGASKSNPRLAVPCAQTQNPAATSHPVLPNISLATQKELAK